MHTPQHNDDHTYTWNIIPLKRPAQFVEGPCVRRNRYLWEFFNYLTFPRGKEKLVFWALMLQERKRHSSFCCLIRLSGDCLFSIASLTSRKGSRILVHIECVHLQFLNSPCLWKVSLQNRAWEAVGRFCPNWTFNIPNKDCELSQDCSWSSVLVTSSKTWACDLVLSSQAPKGYPFLFLERT